jgi:hypothetical protein
MSPPLSLHKYIFADTTPTYTTTTLPSTDNTTTLPCTDTTTTQYCVNSRLYGHKIWYYLNSPEVETRLCCDVMLKQAANKEQREPRKQGEREPQSRRWRRRKRCGLWRWTGGCRNTHLLSLIYSSRFGPPWSGPEWINSHQCTSWPFCPLDGLRFFIRRRMGLITVDFFLLLTTVLSFSFSFFVLGRFSWTWPHTSAVQRLAASRSRKSAAAAARILISGRLQAAGRPQPPATPAAGI